jgi:hypothetical protein
LVIRHPASTPTYPVYVPDPTLLIDDYSLPLRGIVGERWNSIGALEQQVLSIAYRSTKFSAHPAVSARKIAYDLWYGSGKGEAIKEFEAHYRRVRRAVVDLAKAGLLTKSGTESRPEYAVPGVGDAYGQGTALSTA